MPPIIEGEPPPVCENAPDEERILRCWKRMQPWNIPHLYEEHRDNIQIVPELIKDVIDPPKWFPVVGMARVHRCHWKVTIYYDRTVESSYPFPYRSKTPKVDVLYMDLDHLHLCLDKKEKAKLAADAKDLIAEHGSEKADKEAAAARQKDSDRAAKAKRDAEAVIEKRSIEKQIDEYLPQKAAKKE